MPRRGIHPLMQRLRIVTAKGASFEYLGAVKAAENTIFLQNDPTTHPSWTGKELKRAATGQTAKFLKRYGQNH